METRAKRSVVASSAGLKRLEEKRRMSGKRADVIGDLAKVSRSSAQKFFKGNPISVENFQSLCTVLELDWKEIIEPEKTAPSATNRKRVAFVIEGSLDDLDPTKLAKLQAMVRALQQLTGDASITTVEIEEGSIRLILEGSEEGIKNLKQLFDEGELAEVLDTPIRAVESIESDVPNREEVREDCLKALLISTVQSQGALRANLSGADLRAANLSEADLRAANLSEADLRAANLSGADLSNSTAGDLARLSANANASDLITLATALATAHDLAHDIARNLATALATASDRDRDRDLAHDIARDCDLARDLARNLAHDLARASTFWSANFSNANLSNANLSNANLSNANFSNANLSNAIVQNAQFGRGVGLTGSEKRDLERRGAIFDESTGDREFSLR